MLKTMRVKRVYVMVYIAICICMVTSCSFRADSDEKTNGNGMEGLISGNESQDSDNQNIQNTNEYRGTYDGKQKDKSPQITIQPRDCTIYKGERTDFSLEAEGENLKYVWFTDQGDEEFVVDSYGTCSWIPDSEESDNPDFYFYGEWFDGWRFRCKVYNDYGWVYSDEVKLTVNDSYSDSAVEYLKKYNNVIEEISDSASKTRAAYILISDVWFDTIFDKNHITTSKYIDESKDFNKSLQNLFSDEEFIDDLDDIQNSLEDIDYDIEALNNPPSGCSNAYDAIQDLYKAYSAYVDKVTVVEGNYMTYTDGCDSAYTKYESLLSEAEKYKE